jgi:hypothetical protein
MAALIHRDEAIGIIAQRILGSDQTTNDIIDSLIAAMWIDPSSSHRPSVAAAIEVFGWSVVREVSVTAMLHQVHLELLKGTDLNPIEFDRHALAVLTGAVNFGAEPFAALLANVGIAGLAAIDCRKYAKVRQSMSLESEGLCHAERAEFGFDHATLGAAMLWAADMPDEICRTVLLHANPSSPIWIAEGLSASIGHNPGFKRATPPESSPVGGDLAPSPGNLDAIKSSMRTAARLPEFFYLRQRLSRAA